MNFWTKISLTIFGMLSAFWQGASAGERQCIRAVTVPRYSGSNMVCDERTIDRMPVLQPATLNRRCGTTYEMRSVNGNTLPFTAMPPRTRVPVKVTLVERNWNSIVE